MLTKPFNVSIDYGIKIRMDRKILKNYIYNILYQVFVLVTPFITVPYVTRTLGAEFLGINDWTAGNVQWFVLFGQLGVSIYGNKTIAQIRDNPEKRSQTFWEIFLMQVISLALSLMAYVIFIFVGNRPEFRLYAAIQGISIISVALDVTWLFYGMEDFAKASIRNVIIKILSIFAIFTFVKSPQDLSLFIFINAVSGVIGQCWMWIQVKEYIKFTKVSLSGILVHFKPNFMLFVPQIATSIYTMLDISMLGYLNSDKSQVSLYQQAQRFIKMFLFFITSIGTVMLPRVANLNANGKTDEIQSYIKTTLRMAVYLALPMIAGICTMINTFIGWFLPASFSSVSFLIICTSPIVYFISLSNVYGTQYLLPIGKTQIYTRSVVTGACVNAIINAILMPSLGALGAIIGSVSSELMVTMTQYVYIRKHTTIRVDLNYFFKYLIAAICMGVVVYFVAHSLPYNIFSNCVSILSGIVVYFGILILIKDDFTLKMVHKAKGMVIRRG